MESTSHGGYTTRILLFSMRGMTRLNWEAGKRLKNDKKQGQDSCRESIVTCEVAINHNNVGLLEEMLFDKTDQVRVPSAIVGMYKM